MATLPNYVIDGNLYDGLGSVQLTDVVMHSFCIPADRTKLQAWLDKTFSAPSGGAARYTVLTDRVFLSFAEIGKLFLIVPKNEAKGYTSEIDVTVWIMALREGDGLPAIRWIPAYLFVNSGPALVSGREVWGFPKQLGQFDFQPPTPAPGGGPRSFTMEGWVVNPYGANSPARWATMFEARPKAPATPTGILPTLEALAEKAAERLTGDLTSLAGRVQEALGFGGMTMAFLKQFPDAVDPFKACYQAVVETDAQISQLRGSGLTDDHYEVRVTSFATHPYLDELGVSGDWQDVGQGVWIDFDFVQQLGQIVWQAT
jgi:hypothetical protein